MNTDIITSKLIDYREGNLTKEQSLEVEEYLKMSKEWQAILAELDLLDDLMGNAPLIQPTKKSKQRFETLLKEEKEVNSVIKIGQYQQNHYFNIRQIMQMAAAITVLIMGVGIGIQWKNNQNQQAEIAALKTAMQNQKKLLALSLLQQNSASDRIKGVNISLKETTMDEQILNALIDRMNIDKNINVQLKAIDGLAEFSTNKKVITALIKALPNQESPEVQIAIMDVLIASKVKEAYPQFQKILKDKKAIDAVKNRAASGLEVLL